MKTICRLVLRSLLALLLAGSAARAEDLPDVVLFDEDDSIGIGYYDASVGIVTPPSLLTRGGPGDKLIIDSTRSYTGQACGLLEWQSAAGGTWKFFIARPGWSTFDVSAYTNLVIYLNGPAAVIALDLPGLGLESSPPDVSSATVWLGDYLPEGVDADPATWQPVVIPLSAFPQEGGFSLAKVKGVYLTQGEADNAPHTLWFDNIRFRSSEVGSVPPPPAAPTGLVAHSGDRSVVLHWQAGSEPVPAGYHVYRAQGPGATFTRLTANPVSVHAYADLALFNNRVFSYRVSAVDTFQQEGAASTAVDVAALPFANDAEFLEYVQRTAFEYFWYQANPLNGLVRDRSDPTSAASIAATGFGLTAIGIAIDHGWITREEGRDRVLATLRTFTDTPQGDDLTGTIGHQGWFYHFLAFDTAHRAGTSELSSIDTALLLAGVLYAREYFDGQDAEETTLRSLADALVARVNWTWMLNGDTTLSMGWRPESGFLNARWVGYNEAMILYLIGLGVAADPLPAESWAGWTAGYTWGDHQGRPYIQFPPLFGHQYSHCWVDFRHIADSATLAESTTYFENSRRATLAQQAYAIANPAGHTGYASNLWGFTACDGPGTGGTFSYIARGAPPAQNDDGTVAPTAVGGSLPFAPEICLPTLRSFYDTYRATLWTAYGFRDAFNLGQQWWGPHVLGIDQGPILIMIENYRSGRVWSVFQRSAIIQRGLARAGFVRLPFEGTTLQPAPDSAFEVNWPSVAGVPYQVETSSDLLFWRASPTGWLTVDGATASWLDSGPPATDAAPANVHHRFYRVFRVAAP